MPECSTRGGADLAIVRWLSLLRYAAAAVGVLALIVTFTPLVPGTAARLAADWTDGGRNALILLIASGDPARFHCAGSAFGPR